MKTRRFWFIPASVLIGLLTAVMFLTGASALPGTTERVSVDSAGVEANDASSIPTISSDGRFVAFHSFATNLVAGDTNSSSDVFVHDRQTGATTRVSVDSSGVEGNGNSFSPDISDDGRLVAFYSFATNLVTGDTNNAPDVFVHDLVSGVTERASVDSAGVEGNQLSQSPSISGDGRFVGFLSNATNLVTGDTNNVSDDFVHDRQTGATTMISVDSAGNLGNGGGGFTTFSGDDRFVAFSSTASNLVTGDTNGASDVFVRDRDTDLDGIFDEAGAVSTTIVSVDSLGVQGNSTSANTFSGISRDGRFVAFFSFASNLVAGDTNGVFDIFVHDLVSGVTERVSVDSAGVEGNGRSLLPAISRDGHFVAFYSLATNLVAGDTNGSDDVFVHDRQSGATVRVSVDSGGTQGNGSSLRPAISGDGCIVTFDSSASNLVAGDTNNTSDVFVHDLGDTDGDGNCDPFDSTPLGVCGGLPVTIAGTPGNDVINGTAGSDVIHGFAGDDAINGLGGNDVICGGDGNDTLNGGTGNDRLFGGNGSDTLNGGKGNDTLLGEDGNDVLNGDEGRDSLSGGDGNDSLAGGADGDNLNGGAGDDVMDGGAATDTVSFADAPGTVSADLSSGTASGEGNDTLATIENVIGSAFDDTLIGDAGSNFLDGADGNDSLYGRAGNDTLKGGAGDDFFDGGLGNHDVCDGGPGIDTAAPLTCEPFTQ